MANYRYNPAGTCHQRSVEPRASASRPVRPFADVAFLNRAPVKYRPLTAVGMLDKLRQFFQTRAGAATAGVILLLSLILAFFAVRSVFTNEGERLSAGRLYIDAKTGKPYRVELTTGMTVPTKAPSGGDTGYPAELCYWTKDGKVKEDPTPVLLNQFKGKPEPTFCPDCGRLVVGHNPRPQSPSDKPPPTETEYKSRRR